MFFSFQGKITYKGENFLALEIGDISYQIFVSESLLKKVKLNENLKILTYLYLREETQELYGFTTLEELEFFKKLLAISGVGPKIAQAIVSLGKISEIKKAIEEGQVEFFTKISGIGRKTAQKIILESKGKIEKIFEPKVVDKNLMAALLKLGYKQFEIREILPEIPPEIEGTKERLKYALKILGKK